MKTLSIELPDDLDSKLQSHAQRNGKEKREIICEAIEAFLGEGVQSVPGSFLEKEKELAGSIEGPGDLSFNKKHLQGYGR